MFAPTAPHWSGHSSTRRCQHLARPPLVPSTPEAPLAAPPPNPAARQNWRTNTTSKVPGPVIISIAPIVDAQGFSALLGIVAIDTNRAPIKCNCRPSVKDNCK